MIRAIKHSFIGSNTLKLTVKVKVTVTVTVTVIALVLLPLIADNVVGNVHAYTGPRTEWVDDRAGLLEESTQDYLAELFSSHYDRTSEYVFFLIVEEGTPESEIEQIVYGNLDRYYRGSACVGVAYVRGEGLLSYTQNTPVYLAEILKQGNADLQSGDVDVDVEFIILGLHILNELEGNPQSCPGNELWNPESRECVNPYEVVGQPQKPEPENEAPIADFHWNPTNPKAEEPVLFDDDSYDPDGQIVKWEWDFGDGATSTERNPTHTYEFKGSYEVSLTVTDDEGASTKIVKSVSVEQVVGDPPIAEYTYTPENPIAGDQVWFDASSSSDPDGSIVSYEWDFESDGTVDDTGEEVKHTYPKEGHYTVTLTVTDNDGLVDKETKPITVTESERNEPPEVDFDYKVGYGLTVDFYDYSHDPDGQIVKWEWDFGDGATSTERNPTHTYESGGNYEVSLTVTDNEGASNSVTKQIELGEGELETAKVKVLVIPFAVTNTNADFWIQEFNNLKSHIDVGYAPVKDFGGCPSFYYRLYYEESITDTVEECEVPVPANRCINTDNPYSPNYAKDILYNCARKYRSESGYDFNVIIGITDSRITFSATGCSPNVPGFYSHGYKLVVMLNRPLKSAIHELGHYFDFIEQYCDCYPVLQDQDPTNDWYAELCGPTAQPNPLKKELGCEAGPGNGCCDRYGQKKGFPDACGLCKGNYDYTNQARTIMSALHYSNLYFSTDEYEYLASKPEFRCG